LLLILIGIFYWENLGCHSLELHAGFCEIDVHYEEQR